MKKIAFCLSLFLLFCVCFNVYSQERTVGVRPLPEDSVLSNMFYFHWSKTDYATDSLYKLEKDFGDVHFYDPIFDPQGSAYLYLSLPGSPCKDVVYSLDNVFSYDRQANVYAPYVYNSSNVKYMQNSKAYSSFAYSGGGSNQQYFDVIFARNLYKGLNLQTNYNVNYADGNMNNSAIMNQYFDISTNYISDKGRYRSNFAFVHSRAYINENGGLENAEMFFNSDYSSLETYPTKYDRAWSKWKTNEFYWSQSFRLAKDTVKSPIFNAGAIVHSLSFEKYARLYQDDEMRDLDSLATWKQRNSVYWTNYIAKSVVLPLHLGVNYDIVCFRDGLRKPRFYNFSPEIIVGKKGKNSLSFQRCFSQNSYDKDYDLELELKELVYIANKEKNEKLFTAGLGARLTDRQADYIFTRHYSELYSWRNNPGKTNTKTFSLFASYKQLLDLRLSFYDISDFYAMDQKYRLLKADAKLWQMKLGNRLKIKSWDFKGFLALQHSNNKDLLAVPVFVIRQSVGYNFKMMKERIPSVVGLDVNYMSSFFADMYDSPTGLFVRQDEIKTGNHIYADIFFSIYVKRFTLFVSLLHLMPDIQKHDYFNSPLYPHSGFAFRYGISWTFTD